MEKTDFLDKSNFDDVYLRNVIAGFLGFLKQRFFWYNESEELGKQKVDLLIYYSLLGDNRYIMDAFYDDAPDKRVNMNTDQIPRATIKLDSWSVKNDELTNTTIWLNLTKEENDELIEVAAQCKAVPVKLNFTLETVVDNEIDIFKAWQTYMENLYVYKYFSYDYNRMPVKAVFNFSGDTDNPLTREKTFGDKRELIISFPLEVHTFFPIFDNENDIENDKRVRYILDIFQNGQQDVTYIGPKNKLN